MSHYCLLTQAHQSRFKQLPTIRVQAPGRVNLIGEHTDYNQGFVFPAAINFGTQIAASPRDDRNVHVIALDFGGEENHFCIDEIERDPSSEWANYVRGVVLALRQVHGQIKGANLTITGNVPQGAGLSSSASFEIAILKAFKQLYNLPLDGLQAALLGQKAENEFVGCACGIMDQLISAMGEKGSAMLLDCRDYSMQHTHLPEHLSIVIINSNVKRGLVDSEYNLRRQQCEEAARVMQIESLREATLAHLSQHKANLNQTVYRRARHIITENQRTVLMKQALEQGDMKKVSDAMAASHRSMRDDFEITVEPIDYLVNIIGQVIGQRGGVRMTGGGFGGCVVALVPNDLVQQVRDTVEQRYQAHTGIVPSIYVCSAEQGAFSE